MMSDNSEASERLRSPVGSRRCYSSGENSEKFVTGHRELAHQASWAKFDTSVDLKNRHKTRLATWNLRGLLKPGKLEIVERSLCAAKITFAGLSEMHYSGSGHFTSSEGNFVCYAGNVGFWVAKEFSNTIRGYNTINDRIITLRLNARPTIVHLIQVYAPTSTASDEDVETFYGNLENVLRAIPNREITILMGDFNAKVGNTELDDHIRQTVGRFGIGVRNSRGERLIQFCLENGFSISNTMFSQHPRRLYTWISPDGKYRNQIDYIMIKNRWRSSIRLCKTLPGSDCGSDHQLLMCTFQQSFKKCQRTIHRTLPKITDAASFRTQVRQNIADDALLLNPAPINPNIIWQSLKRCITDAITQSQDGRNSIPRQPWMDPQTLYVIEQRRLLKASNLHAEDKITKYNEYTRQIQRLCRRDKNNYIREICREIQSHFNCNTSRDLFQKIKLLTRKFKPKNWAVKDKEGNLVTDLDQVIMVWQQYCMDLYADNDYIKNRENNITQFEPDILLSEVEDAINKLKSNKSPGIDAITADTLRFMGKEGLRIIHQLCQGIWSTGLWPDDWRTSVFIPLHKKGDTNNCDNYRLLALISHTSKIFLYILRSRLEHYLLWQISPEQAGFTRGRGTREQILNIRQIIEKSREFYTPTYLCFVDYSKAFDNIKWEKLWSILLSMGVPDHLVYLIQQLYDNNSARVRVNKCLSDEGATCKGVRQGCVLSPLLFNIYSEFIMRQVLEDWHGGVNIGGTKLSNLRFADDTTLIAGSQEEILELLKRLEDVSALYGLNINYNKTKIMIIDREHNNYPETRSIGHCEVVNSFVYLGALIENTGGCECEIRRRIQLARSAMTQLNKIWRDRNITKQTKINLVSTLVFSIFLYASESWTVKEVDRRRIDAFEMWAWRRMLRVSWTAHRTNASILEEIRPSKRLSSIVYSRILKFFGHINRSEHMERLIVQGKPEGSRRRGRSPNRWVDITKKLLDVTLPQAAHMSSNRDKWRDAVKRAIQNIEPH